MRIGVWVASLFVGCLLASPCWAQVVSFGSVNPTQIVNRPVVVPSSAIAAPMQAASTGFSLTNLFSNFALPLGKPVHGQSSFPGPGQMPGKAYLNAFGYSRGAPIAP